MKPSEVLEKAAAIVDVRWRQGAYGDEGGPRCALGALQEAAPYGEVAALVVARDILANAISPAECRYRHEHDVVVEFNDDGRRTSKSVARKLREAAAKAREAGQ